jgi:hypothetical protein
VLEIDTPVWSDGGWLRTVVDAPEYPEVADLARIPAMEGTSDIATDAICVPADNDHQLLLGI